MSLKTIPALLLLCITCNILTAQNKTYQIKADSVRIFSNCDTAELILQNRTRNVLNGVLTNKGNGVTEFKKILTKIDDSTCIIGGDTLHTGAGGNAVNRSWLLSGNPATNPANQFIGTTDVADWAMRTNNIERARIAANGNFGIGTSAPLASLHIKGTGTTDATNSLVVTNSQDTKILTVSDDQTIDFRPNKYNQFAFLRSRAIHDDGRFAFDISDGYNGVYQLFSVYYSWVGFGQNYASPDYATHSALRVYNGRTYIDNLTVGPSGAAIYGPYGVRGLDISRNGIATTIPSSPDGSAIRDDLSITGSNIYLTTGNSSTIAVTVSNQGNTGFGTSYPTAKLHTLGTVRFEDIPSATGDQLVIDAYGNVGRGGGVPSDFNLKENIVFSQFNSNKLLGMPVKDFNYKSDKDKTRYTGLIAQELKMVIPELVLGKEGNYSIDYVKMVPYLLKAIQDQQKEINELKQPSAAGNNTTVSDVMAQVQQLRQQIAQQQEEMKVLKEQVKNK